MIKSSDKVGPSSLLEPAMVCLLDPVKHGETF